MIATSFNEGWGFRRKRNDAESWEDSVLRPPPYAPVTLPHDAMLHAGRDLSDRQTALVAFFRQGVYEYSKTFVAPEEWRDRRVTLRFEGVYRGALVHLNGEFAGQHAAGYSEFAVKLDDLLRYDAENELHVEARTYADARWYSGGGIYRNVSLFVTDLVHVALDGVRVTTPDVDDRRATVLVETAVENETSQRRTIEVTTELLDAEGMVVATGTVPLTVPAASVGSARQRLHVGAPERWSVDHPYLYTCRTRVASSDLADEAMTTFGIRTLSVDPDDGLRINGETVKLRGACIHHDNGVIGAATIDRADARRIQLLKEAGFNAVRSAHHPIGRALLDACDRVGMLVMDEAFDVWRSPKVDFDYSHDFPTWWERDIESMVLKDRNHPSVIMYSIGNEIPETGNPSGALMSRILAEKVRSLDSTRFVTNGVSALFSTIDELVDGGSGGGAAYAASEDDVWFGNLPGAAALMDSDVVANRLAESFAALDIAGYNYLDRRYEIDGILFPNRVIVGSETYARAIDTNWELVRTLGHVIGDFTWTGWDYLGEIGVGRIIHERGDDTDALGGFDVANPWLTARCGDIDITGHRRPPSYYREIVFGLRQDPFIAVHRPQHHGKRVLVATPWSWSDSIDSWSWPNHVGRPVTVEVYADADEVELLLDGEVVGRLPAGAPHRYTAVFETSYVPGELVAVAYRDGEESGRHTLRSAGSDVHLGVEVDRAEIAADHHDLAFVGIRLVDVDGLVHTDADRPVTVAVGGPGILQGLGSGRPATGERFLDATHNTFDGRALAVVRPTAPGQITVRVEAEGCEPVAVRIDAVEVVPS